MEFDEKANHVLPAMRLKCPRRGELSGGGVRRVCRIVIAVAAVVVAPHASADDGIWQGGNPGLFWSTPGNWVGGVIPNGAGATASFDVDLPFDTFISVDVDSTLGRLVFSDNGGAGSQYLLTHSPTLPTITLAGGGQTPRITAKTNVTMTLHLAGNEGLVKDGDATLILAHTNSYTGGTTIEAGTLQLGNGFQSGSIVGDVVNNAALVVNRFDAYTFAGNMSGNGTIGKTGFGTLILTGDALSTGGITITAGGLQVGNGGTGGRIVGSVVNNSRLIFDRSDDSTFNGTISGAGTVAKNGAGTLTLLNANTHTGTTTVTGGALRLANAGALQNSLLALNAHGGLKFAGGVATASVTGLTGTGNLTLADESAAAVVLTVGSGNVSTTFSGAVSGPGGLVKVGTAPLALTGALTYAGGTTIASGTLQVNINGPNSFGGPVLNNGALIVFSPLGGPTTFNVTADIGGSGIVTINGIAGTKAVFTGASNYTGGTTISAGTTLQLGDGGATGSLTGNVVTSGTLAFQRSDAYTFNGIISGAGNVLTAGSGTVTLAATNTFSGVASVNTGALRLANAAALQSATVDLSSTGTVTFSAGITAPSFAGLRGTAAGANLALVDELGAAVRLTVGGNNQDTTFSGVLSNIGGLIKADSGTLTLVGGNTYSGGTTISGGVLQVGGGGTTGAIVGDVLNNGRLFVNRFNTVTLPGNVSGGGDLVVKSGTVILTGANTYSGGTIIENGTLQLGNGAAGGSITGNVAFGTGLFKTLAFNRSDVYTFAGLISGNGDLRQNGAGTLVLTQANTFSGTTTVAAGAIRLANAQALKNSPVSINVNNGLTFAAGVTAPVVGSLYGAGSLALTDQAATPVVLAVGLANFSGTFGGVISGDGGLRNVTGTLTLSGASNYTGGTTVSGGYLRVRSNAALGAGAVFVEPTGSLELSTGIALPNAVTLAGGTLLGDGSLAGPVTVTAAVGQVATLGVPLTGNGSLTKRGAGTLTVSTPNPFNGGTTIVAGLLRTTHNNALGTGGVVLGGDGRLDVATGVTLANPISFDGGGVLSGGGTVAANITVDDGGTLSPGNSPGTMTFADDLFWGPNGHYLLEFNDVDAGAGDPGWDLIDVADQLIISATVGAPFAIDVKSLTPANVPGLVHDFDAGQDYDWVIAQAGGGITGFSPELFTINLGGFANSYTGGFSLFQSGNGLYLQYTAVPEPGSLVLAGIAATGWYARRRAKEKRRRAPAAAAA